jgi:hypothetical protein
MEKKFIFFETHKYNLQILETLKSLSTSPMQHQKSRGNTNLRQAKNINVATCPV